MELARANSDRRLVEALASVGDCRSRIARLGDLDMRSEDAVSEADDRPSAKHVDRTKRYAEKLLPALREVARAHGYALALHGSVERDIDLIAVPWVADARSPASLAEALRAKCEESARFAIWPLRHEGEQEGGSADKPVRKPHGRLGYSILLAGGPYIDLSVMQPHVVGSNEVAVAQPSDGFDGDCG